MDGDNFPTPNVSITADQKWRTEHFVVGVVWLLSATLSGGTLLGFGPLIDALVNAGFGASECGSPEQGPAPCPAQYNALNAIYNGAFQILTVSTCIWGLLIGYLGPRLLACLGLLISMGGRAILAGATKSTPIYALIVAFGMVGAGGNALYVSAFTFADLFPGSKASAIAAISASFNVAGLALIVLNFPFLYLEEYWKLSFAYCCAALLVVVVVFPRVPYRRWDRWRALDGLSLCVEEDTPAQILAGLLAEEESNAPLKPPSRAQVRAAVFDGRFLWLCLTVAWCSVCTVVVNGMTSSLLHAKGVDEPEVVSNYLSYVFPVIASGTVVVAPFVGTLINRRRGFVAPLALMVVLTQGMLGACFLPSLRSQLATMTLSTAATSFCFTIQFAYISITYPPNLYGPLLTVSVGIQGVVGLLAFPGLSPNPFGPTAFAQPLLWILLPPTAVLLYFPYLQWRLERKGEALAVEREWRNTELDADGGGRGASLASSVAGAGGGRGGSQYSVGGGGGGEPGSRLPSFSGFPSASAMFVGAWSSNGSTFEC